MAEVYIANGCAEAPGGEWLVGRAQPAACRGAFTVRGLKGLIVPDRAAVRQINAGDVFWCAAQDRPFLTRLDALPDEALSVASAKLLIAPLSSRKGARNVKLVPMSFRRTLTVTSFSFGWAVVATKSRVTRVTVDEGATLMVRPESVVAWIGKDPTGFCPRLGLLDLLLPRGPKNLAFTFHGPATVWFEGGVETALRRRGR